MGTHPARPHPSDSVIRTLSDFVDDEHASVEAARRVLLGQGGARVPDLCGFCHGAVSHVQAAQATPGLPAVPGGVPGAVSLRGGYRGEWFDERRRTVISRLTRDNGGKDPQRAYLHRNSYFILFYFFTKSHG